MYDVSNQYDSWLTVPLHRVLDWFEVDISVRPASSFRVICVMCIFNMIPGIIFMFAGMISTESHVC